MTNECDECNEYIMHIFMYVIFRCCPNIDLVKKVLPRETRIKTPFETRHVKKNYFEKIVCYLEELSIGNRKFFFFDLIKN